MSKVIYVCYRHPNSISIANRLETICHRLTPDNIIPNSSKILVREDIAYGVTNPTDSTLKKGNSLLLGKLFGEYCDWWKPSSKFPDGSFALFRNGGESLEILTDPAGSRTIWYYLDQEIFISSTSQRAITMLLGSFEFDERVIPWMLSTGSLGPCLSWHSKLKRIPPDSAVLLDKKKWSIASKSNTPDFAISEKADSHQERMLREAMVETLESVKLDLSTWILPLSGGYDSRGLLSLLQQTGRNPEELKTITWGLKSSIHRRKTDAYVASKLADSLKVCHQFYHTDPSEEPTHNIINRFLLLGEGRIDHISAYMDGFTIWKMLFETGVQGVIRGDEGFGWLKVSSPLTVRHSMGCAFCTDFANLRNYQVFGFTDQVLPKNLLRSPGESLSQWRDKLYHGFRLPSILSSLSDLKLPYVEIVNPWLSRRILLQVRGQPDHLRTNKFLYRKIVSSLGPQVAYATRSSIASPRNVLASRDVEEILREELSSSCARALFPTRFLTYLRKGLKTDRRAMGTNLKSSIFEDTARKIVPRSLLNAVLDHAYSPRLNHNLLAFRIFLISRMNTILLEDSKAIRHP